MTEIRFYHLRTQRLDQALPAILSKALAGGRRTLIRFSSEKDMSHFDDHLWTFSPESFLAHGTEGSPHADQQPVLLSVSGENINNADMLILCDAQDVPENTDQFSLCCDFIDGQNEEAVAAGRTRWKAYKDAGHSLTYWQQMENGGWEQKA